MQKNATSETSTPKAAAKPASQAVSSTVKKLVQKVVEKTVKQQKVAKKSDAIKAPKKLAKPKKDKVVRDSFTMPESEYKLLAAIKKRCIAKGLAVKKSEVLRAAISCFATLSDNHILSALKALDVIKTGRPPKGK